MFSKFDHGRAGGVHEFFDGIVLEEKSYGAMSDWKAINSRTDIMLAFACRRKLCCVCGRGCVLSFWQGC